MRRSTRKSHYIILKAMPVPADCDGLGEGGKGGREGREGGEGRDGGFLN